MNTLDWILVGIAGFSVLRGLMRGAVSQIFGIIGILAGFYAASHYYEQVGAKFHAYFPSLSGTGTVAFIVLFILTWFCVAVLGFWIVRVLRSAGLGFLDRLWGAMIGMGKALLLAIAAIAVLTLFWPGTGLLTGSILVPHVQEASRFLFKLAPQKVQEEFARRERDLQRFFLQRSGPPPRSASDHRVEIKEKSEARRE